MQKSERTLSLTELDQDCHWMHLKSIDLYLSFDGLLAPCVDNWFVYMVQLYVIILKHS